MKLTKNCQGFPIPLILLLCLFSLFYNNARSQSVVHGTVTGRDGLALAGTSISVAGNNKFTLADSAGHFVLAVPAGASLLFSSIGYRDELVTPGNETELHVILTETIVNLDEVVMIGYGSSKRKDLTGAIGSLSARNFNRGFFTAPDQLIQGKIAGVQIMQNSGQPGGSTAIKIRGNSALTGTGQPLFVIDGIPLDGRSLQAGNNPLNFINTDDVASIDVLKDASATAIYGSRAAYGIIIINTKKGQPGQPQLILSAATGISSILKKIKVLDAGQYREAIKYYGVNPFNDRGGNENALDAILQKGLQQNYTMSVSGGNENNRYRISGNYFNQDGIIRSTSFKKYGTDMQINFRFLESKKLELEMKVNASQYIKDVPVPASGASSLLQSALSWNPTDSLTNANGSLKMTSGNLINPIAMTDLLKDNLKVTSILAGISPSYKFTNWLVYKFIFSLNYNTGTSRSSVNQFLFPASDPRGSATIGNNELITRQITHTLNFTREIITGLNLNVTAGFEYMKFTSKGFSSMGYGPLDIGFGNFGLDYTNYIQYSSTSDRSISSFADPLSELKSYFGRSIFEYRNRYLLTATLRSDGSTKFGANNKYGYFPAIAFAWNIANEKFFRVALINSLKLRLGWGKTGNQEFPAGSAQARYSFQDNGAIVQVNSPNPDLRWQTDKQYNIGLDFSLLKNRISGTIDYFKKTTTGLLFPGPPVQPAPPLSVVRWVNLDGEILNMGFEITVNGSIINNKKTSWELSANASFLKNNVSKLPSVIETGWLQGGGVSGTSVEVIRNGLPMNAFYTRKFLGMDKTTGFALYEDNGNTFYYTGNPNPKILLGVGSVFRYNKLTLTANMYGAFGQDIFYNSLLNVLNAGSINGGGNIGLSVYKDPVKESLANPVTPSSRFIMKGNYFKMANLTLGYTLGNVAKTFKSASLYISAQNLFIITHYPGFDPEANFDGNINNVPSLGIDYLQYPSSRTFLVGISFSL